MVVHEASPALSSSPSGAGRTACSDRLTDCFTDCCVCLPHAMDAARPADQRGLRQGTGQGRERQGKAKPAQREEHVQANQKRRRRRERTKRKKSVDTHDSRTGLRLIHPSIHRVVLPPPSNTPTTAQPSPEAHRRALDRRSHGPVLACMMRAGRLVIVKTRLPLLLLQPLRHSPPVRTQQELLLHHQ